MVSQQSNANDKLAKPTEYLFERVNCYGCGSNTSKLFLIGQDDYTGKTGNFKYMQCDNCHLVYQNPRISIDQIKYFYDEEYRIALSEVNIALELNPNLAIAYGRRGSIYYKLGDSRRATLNWNVALQLDPEFSEIYEMLQAAEENRLKPVEISKNIGDIE